MNMIAHRERPPTAQEAAIARVSHQAFARIAHTRAPLKLRVTDVEQAEPIELPAGAVALLMDSRIGSGHLQRHSRRGMVEDRLLAPTYRPLAP